MVEKKRFEEADIQSLLLRKGSFFGDIGQSTIVFEKAIMQGNTIADALIFTENRGLIGVEIKTERDSTQRLNKQLRDYSKICDYVYVLCHDDHVAKVEGIMKRYHHEHVGIIAYTEFKGEPVAGMYKEATKSPLKDVYNTINMLWKEEILTILGTFRHPGKRIETELGIPSLEVTDRQGGLGGLYTKSSYSRKQRKPELIHNLITRVGYEEANKIICDIFINNRNHPEKSIKLRHFFPEERGGDNE